MAAFIYLFYASPLRSRIETQLFDLRTRWAQPQADTSKVTLVMIDDQSIAQLDPPTMEQSLHPPSTDLDQPPRDLSYNALIRLVEQLMQSLARDIVVFLPSQVFAYNDPALKRLADLVEQDRRLLLVVFDIKQNIQPEDTISSINKGEGPALPPALARIRGSLARGDIPREFRRGNIRNITIQDGTGLPFLAAALTQRHAPQMLAHALKEHGNSGKASIKLNYFDLRKLKTIKAEKINRETVGDLSHQTVFLGYSAFRPWSLQADEATYVNTPWQIDGDGVALGVPLLKVQSVAFLNLSQNTWLKNQAQILNTLQILLVLSATVFLIWRFSIGFAGFLFLLGIFALMLTHAMLFSWAYVYLPLADSLLFASVAMLGGCAWQLRQEARLRAAHLARTAAEANLAAVQERFLNQFAFELSAINNKIQTTLMSLPFAQHPKDLVKSAFSRMLDSCIELGDYLHGIKQFASLKTTAIKATANNCVAIRPVILQLIGHFAARQSEVKPTDSAALSTTSRFHLDAVQDQFALCDRTVLEQILHNLISNALKYSPAEATVYLSTQEIDSHIVITVRDEGPGIATEFQEHVFEKFYRIKDDRVYQVKGHGLGLYLSRYFAETMQARLTLHSIPGEGASFSLHLRKAKPKDIARMEAQREHPKKNREDIQEQPRGQHASH